MHNNTKLHPYVIQSHLKTKAWNEYVIAYFGMTLSKKVGADYKAMELRQGPVKLFDKFDFQLTRTGNAYMHKQLRTYLEHYMESFKAINDFTTASDFKPPSV